MHECSFKRARISVDDVVGRWPRFLIHYLCVCVCVIAGYIASTNTDMHTYTQDAGLYTSTHTHTQRYMHTYIQSYIHVYMHVCMGTYIYKHTNKQPNMHATIHACKHIHIHNKIQRTFIQKYMHAYNPTTVLDRSPNCVGSFQYKNFFFFLALTDRLSNKLLFILVLLLRLCHGRNARLR